ncbi:glycosyltransferase [Paenibacillus sp. BSR1-1]|uniref:glycosyltransferase n=1 Tax=Paenibacillus sp. BSR1-1 TaxID=3020845 RepID=UPI0025B0E465|nr:glycosyltransferase [Paenibacillus sp. BSR1-1]MDN3019197.1 glycosyltransferase [Paenibacillus sp. BSR1-1]
MISIICCYNNKSVFEQMLKKSIDNQDIECELIGIENVNNKFTSAASALNYGASLAQGDYYIFAHQDIEFYDENFLKSIVEYVDCNQNSIIGLAGRDKMGIYSNITHGSQHLYAGNFKVFGPVEVETLDECFIAMSKNVYNNLKFDEKTCNNWHLYSVDLCLTAKKRGIRAIVVPLEAYHASTGYVSKDYWKSMKKVMEKHKKDHSKIYSTCSVVSTNTFKYWYFRLLGKVKIVAKKILHI